ncbi:MAG: hypothetical protein WBA73_07470, partial [Devosia sp.]
MSLTTLLSPPPPADSLKSASTGNASILPPERSGDALARCMLDAALTPRLRRLLKLPSRLILIKTDDEAAVHLLDRYLGGLDPAPVIGAYSET